MSSNTTVGMVLDALLVVVVLVCLFVCFVIACHCKITASVGDNKLILILSYLISLSSSNKPWSPISIGRRRRFTGSA